MEEVLASIIPFFLLFSPLCEEYSLDPILVASQIKAESDFSPRAKSSVGAIGLMQIMPSTAIWLGLIKEGEEEKLYHPYLNLRVGCYYDAWLRKYWRNKGWEGIWLDLLMVASYNAGAGRVRRNLSQGGSFEKGFSLFPRETQIYCQRIMRFRVEYLWKVAQELLKGVI